MKYLEVFRLAVRHSYYDDGSSPDFTLAPTGETEALLRNHRALAISMRNGLKIVASATPTGETFIPFAEGARFRFHMWLGNADLPLFTDLGGFENNIAPVYETAEGLVLRLGTAQAWKHDDFSVATPSAKEFFVLRHRPVDGLAVADFLLEPGSPTLQLVEYDEEDRRVAIDSRGTSPGQEFTVGYRVPPEQRRGIFADIDIEVTEALVNLKKPAQPAPVYRISFQAKQARWAYYCVTNLDNDLAEFSVVDEPEGDEAALVFGDEGKVDLAETPDPSDRLAQQLAEQYPKLKRYRFVSGDLIPCRQAARKGLKLQLGDNKLPGALPNPSFRSFARLPLKVADRVEEQDCLTAVVRIMRDSTI